MGGGGGGEGGRRGGGCYCMKLDSNPHFILDHESRRATPQPFILQPNKSAVPVNHAAVSFQDPNSTIASLVSKYTQSIILAIQVLQTDTFFYSPQFQMSAPKH